MAEQAHSRSSASSTSGHGRRHDFGTSASSSRSSSSPFPPLPPAASRRPIIVWDTETTGLSAVDHRIVDIAFIFLDLESPTPPPVGESNELSFTSLVRPDDGQRPWDGTDISWSSVNAAPGFRDVWPGIVQFISSNCQDKHPILISHNIAFDYHFLKEELKRIGQKIPAHWDFACSWHDIADVAWPGQRAKLECLARRIGIQHNAHRALADSRAAARVIQYVGSNRRTLANLSSRSIYQLIVDAAVSRRLVKQRGRSWGDGFGGTEKTTMMRGSKFRSKQSFTPMRRIGSRESASTAFRKVSVTKSGGQPNKRFTLLSPSHAASAPVGSNTVSSSFHANNSLIRLGGHPNTVRHTPPIPQTIGTDTGGLNQTPASSIYARTELNGKIMKKKNAHTQIHNTSLPTSTTRRDPGIGNRNPASAEYASTTPTGSWRGLQPNTVPPLAHRDTVMEMATSEIHIRFRIPKQLYGNWFLNYQSQK